MLLVAQPQNGKGLWDPKWILHQQRFIPTLGSPPLHGGGWAPSQPPEAFPQHPLWEESAATQDAQALEKPADPRPSRTPAGGPRTPGHVAEGISYTLLTAPAGGIRGVFLPSDLSGPPLCPSRRVAKRTGQSLWAESVASVPGCGSCVIPPSLGVTASVGPLHELGHLCFKVTLASSLRWPVLG